MRQRFTEINIRDGNSAIPVGAEAKNITLEDGSILEQALGDIKYSENGSIMDQIEKLKQKGGSEYAPLQSPYFKKSLYVRRYGDGEDTDLISQTPISSENKVVRGVTAEYVDGVWIFNGTLTEGEDELIVLYGSSIPTSSIVNSGTYSIDIKNKDVLNESSGISILFKQYHNEATEANDVRQSSTFLSYNSINPNEFIIQENYHLSMIAISFNSSLNLSLTNRKLKIAFYKTDVTDTNENQNTYNTVFDIQKDSSNIWTTSVSENFIVDKGLQGYAKSSLGTIYNSNWEGNLDVKGIVNIKREADTNGIINDTGILVTQSGIGFKMQPDLNNYEGDSGQTKSITQWNNSSAIRNQTPYYIIPMYGSSGEGYLYQIGKDGILLGTMPNGEDSERDIQLTIRTNQTEIRNNLKFVNHQLNSNVLIQYVDFTNRLSIENFINNSNYYNYVPVIFRIEQRLANYFVKGSQNATGVPAMIGMGYKVNEGTTRLFRGYFILSDLYRLKYSWNPQQSKYRTWEVHKMTQPSTLTQTNPDKLIAPNSNTGW